MHWWCRSFVPSHWHGTIKLLSSDNYFVVSSLVFIHRSNLYIQHQLVAWVLKTKYDNLMWFWIMMTLSNGNSFRVTGPLCGEFIGPGEFPAQRPVTRSFDVFFDQRPNKQLSKQPWGWWFEAPSWSLWRQCNDNWINEWSPIWIVLYRNEAALL